MEQGPTRADKYMGGSCCSRKLYFTKARSPSPKSKSIRNVKDFRPPGNSSYPPTPGTTTPGTTCSEMQTGVCHDGNQHLTVLFILLSYYCISIILLYPSYYYIHGWLSSWLSSAIIIHTLPIQLPCFYHVSTMLPCYHLPMLPCYQDHYRNLKKAMYAPTTGCTIIGCTIISI